MFAGAWQKHFRAQHLPGLPKSVKKLWAKAKNAKPTKFVLWSVLASTPFPTQWYASPQIKYSYISMHFHKHMAQSNDQADLSIID